MLVIRECSKCGKSHSRKHYWCADCHASYMRQWRKSHPLTPIQAYKDRSRSYAGTNKRRGNIVEKPCCICGAKAEMHHEDYSEPLKVDWFCREHHLLLHKIKQLCDRGS